MICQSIEIEIIIKKHTNPIIYQENAQSICFCRHLYFQYLHIQEQKFKFLHLNKKSGFYFLMKTKMF